jgi:hypothetical protein
MDSILDKARGGQRFLERLANKIPGFKGYRDKELRRDADRLHREHLASRLETVRGSLDAVANALTRAGALDGINDVEQARKRAEKVVARVRYADRGYAGFFDAVKVDDNALEQVYQFDLDLVGAVDDIVASAQSAATAADPAPLLRELTAQLDALDGRLAEREAILGGFA